MYSVSVHRKVVEDDAEQEGHNDLCLFSLLVFFFLLFFFFQAIDFFKFIVLARLSDGMKMLTREASGIVTKKKVTFLRIVIFLSGIQTLNRFDIFP